MDMRVVRDPEICSGKYVIEGTRIILSELLKSLPEYGSWIELTQSYPSLSTYSQEEFFNTLSKLLGERYTQSIELCVYQRSEEHCKKLAKVLRRREKEKKKREILSLMYLLLNKKPIEEQSIEYKWLKRYMDVSETLREDMKNRENILRVFGYILADMLKTHGTRLKTAKE